MVHQPLKETTHYLKGSTLQVTTELERTNIVSSIGLYHKFKLINTINGTMKLLKFDRFIDRVP